MKLLKIYLIIENIRCTKLIENVKIAMIIIYYKFKPTKTSKKAIVE